MLTADIQNYDQRVATGKIKEKIILETLRKSGMDIADPLPNEDMYDKVDGWILKDGKRCGLQIKFRENGNDILVEIMKDLDCRSLGRDMKGKSEYCLIVDKNGNGKLFLLAPIKALAQKVMDAILPFTYVASDAPKTSWKGNLWEIKITVDRANGNRKLMGYFNPSLFQSLGEWKFNLS